MYLVEGCCLYRATMLWTADHRGPQPVRASLKADPVIEPMAVSGIIPWSNDLQSRRGGAEISAESLRCSGVIAALLLAPLGPHLEQAVRLDEAARGEDAPLT